jgi:hypothetical protein
LAQPQKSKFFTLFFSPSPEVSKKVCNITVRQKLREEIDFEETGHFQPRAVSWRPADLKPMPKNYWNRVGLVFNISSTFSRGKTHALPSLYRQVKIFNVLYNIDLSLH